MGIYFASWFRRYWSIKKNKVTEDLPQSNSWLFNKRYIIALIRHFSDFSDYLKGFTTQVSIHQFTHWWQVAPLQSAKLLISNSRRHVHSQMKQPVGPIWGSLTRPRTLHAGFMQAGGGRDWTFDLLSSRLFFFFFFYLFNYSCPQDKKPITDVVYNKLKSFALKAKAHILIGS